MNGNISLRRPVQLLACMLVWSSACVYDVADGTDSTSASDPEAVAATAQALTPMLSVPLWPDGNITYMIDPSFPSVDRDLVHAQMSKWTSATSGHIQFIECGLLPGPACPPDRDDYLYITYVVHQEDDNTCDIGKASAPLMRIHPTSDNESAVLHELGHCIGLNHEHRREDRDRWLVEGSYDYGSVGDPNSTASNPLLGNYDYDSIMHYPSFSKSKPPVGRWTDRFGNPFSSDDSNQVSPHDASRVLQYYAYELEPLWGFFTSLAPAPSDPDALPDPRLKPGVDPVGVPAIAYVDGTTHIFVRGTDQNMYWKRGASAGTWTSLGCCAGSDPAAVRTGSGQLDLVFVGADTGKVIKTRLNGSTWSSWGYVSDGMPSGGIRLMSNGSVGPAIASRQDGRIDVFVVRTDGRLASISFNGTSWTGWTTHGSNYVVTLRPAAVALSSTNVRLAVTSGLNVLSPSVTFSGTTVTGFTLGSAVTTTAFNQAPGIASRSGSSSAPYRILTINPNGRVNHRLANATGGRDIGGLPKAATGVSAVATGPTAADIVINGTDQLSCSLSCPAEPDKGARIQAGGIWIRRFL